MPVSNTSRDKARQDALLRAEQLETALAMVDTLTDDVCELIYVKIELRLAKAAEGRVARSEVGTPQIVEPRVTTPDETPPSPVDVAPELSFAEVKRRAAEDLEREYLARLMEQSDGSVTDAALLAGVDRSNFRRRLQRAGLRAPGKKKPGPKYTHQILKILDENRSGLRTYEVAQKTGQASPNAFRILKYLEQRGHVERHGARNSALWTLPGNIPAQRIETVGGAIVDVLSRGARPMDRRVIGDGVESILRSRGRTLNSATLNSEILRLIDKGVIARHGANEYGALFALTILKEGDSELN